MLLSCGENGAINMDTLLGRINLQKSKRPNFLKIKSMSQSIMENIMSVVLVIIKNEY